LISAIALTPLRTPAMRHLPRISFVLLFAAARINFRFRRGPKSPTPQRSPNSSTRRFKTRLDSEKTHRVAKSRPMPNSSAAFSLDITGVIPSAERVVAFLENKEPDKRAKLIEELLASPEIRPTHGGHLEGAAHSEHRRRAPDRRHEPFVEWLAKGFAANKKLDALRARRAHFRWLPG